MSATKAQGTPTDLELMLFHDGELEEPRRSEVASWLEQSTVGRGKLAGLGLGGQLVHESAMARAAAFDITNAVMRQVGGPQQEPAKVIELRPKQEERAQRGVGDAASGAERQDGGRLLLPLTLVAAAAAVALFVWGKSGTDDTPVARTQPTEQAEPVQPLPSTKSSALSTAPLFAQAPDQDAEPSVQVASVDFGSRTGAVYYVDGASKGATTTVVWVTEE